MGNNKIKIILDTDVGVDCDDAGAIAVMNILADRGEAEIIGVTHCYSGAYNAGCISALNTYYGRPDIPVGVIPQGKDIKGIYSEYLAENFPNKYMHGEKCEDTVSLTRRLLWNSKDHEITYVAIGSMYSLQLILQSKPDDLCPLDGEKLLRQKLKRTVIMGGRFKETWPKPYILADNYIVDAEFNIKADIEASKLVVSRLPGEIVFCSYEIGWDIITGEPLVKTVSNHPVKAAYELFNKGLRGRESWDLTTMLYAVRPGAGYWDLHEYGRVSVDDTGVTTWTKDKDCRHTYLLVKEEPEKIRKILDDLLITPPAGKIY